MSLNDYKYQQLQNRTNQKEIEDGNCITIPRSRIPSLSSLFSNTVFEEKPHELIGFRRFAKAYILGTEKNTKAKVTNSATQINISSLSYQSNGNYLDRNGLFKGPYLNKIYLGNKFELSQNQQAMTNTHKINVVGKVYDYNLDQHGIPEMIPDLLPDDDDNDDNEHNDGSPSDEGGTTASNISSNLNINTSERDMRRIVLRNIPVGTGIRSIVSQIYGGPLESLIIYRKHSNSDELNKVELNFLTYEGAWSFMKYGRTNLFQVNGKQLLPEWGKIGFDKRMNIDIISKIGLSESNDVSRYLILKRYTNKVDKRNELSKEHLIDNLDIREIRRDFEKFGNVFDITPIISRKLCISISYNDILGAMTAMEDYENPYSYLHQKYFRTWAIWYGKDTTNKPCIEL